MTAKLLIADNHGMRALTVLYGGALAGEAFEAISSALPSVIPSAGLLKNGNSSLALAVERASQFPGTEKLILLGIEGRDYPGLPDESETFSLVRQPSWTKKSLLENLSRLAAGTSGPFGFELCYFAWADCPFLDPALAGAIAARHLRYAAEYSYADGWPYGFAPEVLAPGTPGILSKILADDGKVERDSLFSVLQKDINAFDIETEISPVDLRGRRISLAADSKRNLLLIRRFAEAGIRSAAEAADLIEKRPGLLRTLPAYFNIQAAAACPQECPLCPWPRFGKSGNVPVSSRRDFMDAEKFETLLDKIIAFSGDGVVSLSLWGELALHPEKIKMIKAVLARRELSLVIETSALGWKTGELEELAAAAAGAGARKNALLAPPLSWIVSLDAFSAARYREVRGPGFTEAVECAKKLAALFPEDTYAQAVRVKDFEDDIEQFYRLWKDAEAFGAAKKDGGRVIIQKYDDFCGALPKLQASDLSPVIRRPCWHNMRDMIILLDGSVPRCREDLAALKGESASFGNVFAESLEEIWKRGEALYLEQAGGNYPGICAVCDEYYTYNF